MVSIELLEAEKIAHKYTPKFDNNLSKFLRHLIYEHDLRQNNNSAKQYETIFIIKAIAYLLISGSFLIIAVSAIASLFIILIPAISILCGIFLIAYVILLIQEKKRSWSFGS